MKHSHRSIFREEAIRRYVESKEKAVLPRLVSPRTFTYLWFLLGLLTISSFIAWFTRVPVYISGSAVVTRSHGKLMNDQLHHRASRVNEDVVVVAFFPSQYLSSLQTSQKLFLSFDVTGISEMARNANYFDRSIIAVVPRIISPADIQKHFALKAQVTNQPAVVAIAHLEPIPAHLPATAYMGSIGQAKVEIGSQRLVSLLPLIGQFFKP